MEHLGTATYSPEDNKLRLYPFARLGKEDYERFKAAGFKWAPRQELFVAPMWTPGRADLLTETCGDIGDEDTSLVDRVEDRAERFEGYSDKRASDAQAASDGVKAITDGIPFGQPILVGHHSERHARRDAQRIENGMRKTVKMWETSEYWTRRAAGALHHAKYKERPDVRARRIKKIQAERRKTERSNKEGENFAKLVASIKSHEQAAVIAGRLWWNVRHEGEHVSASTLLERGAVTWEQLRDRTLEGHERSKAFRARWLAHYDNRLAYETALLEEQGGSNLLKPKARPKQPPLCNYRAPKGIDVLNPYQRGEMMHLPQVEMTRAEYAAINVDYKGTRNPDPSHRIRSALHGMGGRRNLVCVFLTDSKVHDKPEPVPTPAPIVESLPARIRPTPEPAPATAQDVAAMKDQLRNGGVQVAVAPQLFPTPPGLAARMVELADIDPRHKVLEPSAGTGNILKAIGDQPDKVAVEVNASLVEGLARLGVSGLRIHQADFLECNGELGAFDRIVMNPPFADAADIAHIEHAATLLKPGGRLVAICANGPRQQERLRPQCAEWHELPPDTLKDSGTGVNAALVIIERA